MESTYHALARFAQSAGLLYLVAVFLSVCAYAFWPRNRSRFERAALQPLQED